MNLVENKDVILSLAGPMPSLYSAGRYFYGEPVHNNVILSFHIAGVRAPAGRYFYSEPVDNNDVILSFHTAGPIVMPPAVAVGRYYYSEPVDNKDVILSFHTAGPMPPLCSASIGISIVNL